jgi:hypothetical protein
MEVGAICPATCFVERALLVDLESREFSASSDLARLGGGFKTASDRSAHAIGP